MIENTERYEHAVPASKILEMPRAKVNRELQVEAFKRYLLVGAFLTEQAIQTGNNVGFARAFNHEEGFGLDYYPGGVNAANYAQALIHCEQTVPAELSESIQRLFLGENYSYRMTVVSSILAMYISDSQIKSTAAVVESNMKLHEEPEGESNVRRCSEPGAELTAVLAGLNYTPAMNLVSDPIAASSVEGIMTPTIWPCLKTCIEITFANSTFYPEDLLVLASSHDGQIAQAVLLNDVKEGNRGKEEALNQKIVGSFLYDKAYELFCELIKDGSFAASTVPEIVQHCLLETAVPVVDDLVHDLRCKQEAYAKPAGIQAASSVPQRVPV